jgi:hypothetical protein
MRSKRLPRKHFVVILLCCVAFGLGLSHNANAQGPCEYVGYVIQVYQEGPSVFFEFREKPIDAGFYRANIGSGSLRAAWELAQLNILLSAQANKTKVVLSIYPPGACPTPDLSMPGRTDIGGTTVGVSSFGYYH